MLVYYPVKTCDRGPSLNSMPENIFCSSAFICNQVLCYIDFQNSDVPFLAPSVILDELLSEVLDERIVKIYGASLKVHNALKSVLGLLRKFLVDHGVLHLFERKVIIV